MNQSTKIIIGILTVLPFVLLILLLGIVFGMVFDIFGDTAFHSDPQVDPETVFGDMFYIIFLSIALGLLSFVMLIYYIVHAVTNKRLENTTQVLWILILLFTSPIGSMVYWYVNIWRDQPIDMGEKISPSGYTN